MDDKKRERDRRYREKKKLAEAALAPKEPHFDQAPAGEDKMAIARVKLSASGNPPTVEDVLQREYPGVLRHPEEIAAAPSQLDRIEALLLELVETNRKMHPNISEALGGF